MHQQLASGEARRQTSFSSNSKRALNAVYKAWVLEVRYILYAIRIATDPAEFIWRWFSWFTSPLEGELLCPVMKGLVCSVSSPAATRDCWAARVPSSHQQKREKS